MQRTEAYDLSLFENRPSKKIPRMRVEQGGKLQTDRLMRRMRTVFGILILLALVTSYIHSQAIITELTTDLQQTQRQLVAAQSDHDYLSGLLDSKTSLKNVEEIATSRLGLMKVDKSQITYVTLERESVITRPGSGLQSWLETFSAGLLSIADYLNP